jgi:hypothetical protein
VPEKYLKRKNRHKKMHFTFNQKTDTNLRITKEG